MSRPANDEMVQGYRDGYDLTAPEPSDNRSHSYRHGFMVGRGEKTRDYAGNYTDLNRAADAAMDADGLCPGGIDPGFDECPKCGATMDDDCAFSSGDR